MNKTKRYRITQEMYRIIQKANGGLFLLYTRHNPGDVLNLLLDGNDIGLLCRVESCNDRYYKYCKVINNKDNLIKLYNDYFSLLEKSILENNRESENKYFAISEILRDRINKLGGFNFPEYLGGYQEGV